MEHEIGRISHFFSKIGVAVLDLTHGDLHIGDTIHVQGHTSDFFQKVQSMQVDHAPVESAEKGMQVGLKLEGPARVNDKVYRIKEE